MGLRESYGPGTFCWVELATTDAGSAKAFYGELFGWVGVDVPVGESSVYTMLRLDDVDVAALYEQSPEGGPPSWLSYVSTPDADAAAARVGEHGGTVLSAPFDIYDVGRMAVVQDPQGALFALWEPRRHIGARRVNDPGCFCWNELATTDSDEAAAFYALVFGWTTQTIEGDTTGYRVIVNAGRRNGGIGRLPESSGSALPAWAVYFTVADIDWSAGRIGELGGRIRAGPVDVPPIGRFLLAEDPQGATFSLFEGIVDD